MDDPVRVCVGEPRQDPLEHARRLRQRQVRHVRAQRAPFEVLHGDERHAVLLDVVVDLHDVLVAQAARDARLP